MSSALIYWTYDSSTTTLTISPTSGENSFRGDERVIPAWRSYQSQITSVNIDGEIQPTYTEGWFTGFSVLTSFVGLNNLDSSDVINMSYMFASCKQLTSLDLSFLDTSNVTSMDNMFSRCSNITSLNLSNFDMGNVQRIDSMFYQCSALTSLNITGWDTSNVTRMDYAFYACSQLSSIDVGSFNVSNVVNASRMFQGCSGLTALDLSSWDVRNINNMSSMFQGCSSLTSLNIQGWETTSLVNAEDMFGRCEALTTLNFAYFITSLVTTMNSMFYGCEGLTELDLTTFDTTNVTDMDNMFYDCVLLETIKVSNNWDDLSVTTSTNMFYECQSLVGAISYDSTKLTVDYANYNTGYFTHALAPSMIYWLYQNNCLYLGSSRFTGDVSGRFLASEQFTSTSHSPWNDLEHTSIEITSSIAPSFLTNWFAYFNNSNNYARRTYTGIQGLSNINTKNLTNLDSVFKYVTISDTTYTLDLTDWDVSNINSMMNTFDNANMVIDVSTWRTYNVVYMTSMFAEYNAPIKVELNLSSFTLENISSMATMFYDLGVNVDVLDITNFNVADSTVNIRSLFYSGDMRQIRCAYNWINASTSSNIFSSCVNLKGAIAYSGTKLTAEYANYVTGYFTYIEPVEYTSEIVSSIYNLVNTELRHLDMNVYVLDYNYRVVDEISGAVTSASVSLDADSDIRRTANVSMVLQGVHTKVDYWTAGNPYWFDKYIKIEVGIKNATYYNINTIGAYDNTTQYAIGDIVYYDNKLYQCKDVSHMSVALLDSQGNSLLDSDGNVLYAYQGEGTYVCGVPPYDSTTWSIVEEYTWYNQGIYMINAPSISYDATSNTLSFQAVDLMSKLTGMRSGYLEGMSYQITSGSSITGAIKSTLNEQGFTKMILNEPSGTESTTTPIDINIDIGSTAYDLLTQLRDINPNWEMFFDVNGVFRFQQIPSGNDVVPEFSDTVWDAVMTSYGLDTSFEDVKNYVEVVGKQVEPDETATATYSGTTATITLARPVSSYYSSVASYSAYDSTATYSKGSCVVYNNAYYVCISTSNITGIAPTNTTYWKVADLSVVWYIGFTLGDGSLSPTELPNAITTITVQDSTSTTIGTITINGEPLYYNNETYYLRLTFNNIAYVSGAFAGYLQPRAIAFDNDPASPFYVGQYTDGGVIHEASELTSPTTKIHSLYQFTKMVRGVFSGDDYDNIYTNDLALQRAKYELYLNCRLHDTVSINCIPLYWLDVNKVMGFTPKGESDASKWIIKSINTDISVDGSQSVTAMRYYALYNS